MDLTKRDWQRLSTWLFTMVLLVGAFGLYSYIYVERRQQYFAEKKLRELRLLGDRLKLRVENIANNVFPNAVKETQKPPALSCKTDEPDPSLNVYEIQDSLLTSPKALEIEAACDFLTVSDKIRLVPNFSLEKFVGYRPLARATGGKPAGTIIATSSVSVRTEGDTPALLFTFRNPSNRARTHSVEWRGRIAVPSLLGQFVTESFDQLVVTETSGIVQFQIGATHIRITNLRSLVERAERLDKSGKPTKEGSAGEEASGSMFASARDSTSVVSIKLAGEDYLLFLQSVKIALIGSSGADQVSSGSPLDWRIAGLISRERFTRESSTFSYTVILLFLFLLLLVVFAEPFIKIASLGPLDRLQKRDVVSLFLSAALTSALITFFVANLYVYGQLERRIDSQLGQFGNSVRSRLDGDLNSLLPLLQDLSEEQIPAPQSTEILNLLGDKKPLGRTDDKCKSGDIRFSPDTRKSPSSADLQEKFLGGALFERISWIDPCGKQRRKWTIYNTNTPLIQVGERLYFQRARNAQLWKKTLDDKPFCFWLGPIESWNTGETLATLSMRGPATEKENAQASPTDPVEDIQCSGHPDQSSHWVVTLDAILPSLRNVVLPPGYGFVVIEDSGNVLFHSDSGRHLRENFLQESDQEPALRAAVFGHSVQRFNANYLGTSHRLYVQPFHGLPWTLVVFYDKHYLRTTNLEILSLALILYLLMMVFLLPMLVLLWFRETGWLWLHKEYRDSYPQFLLGALLLSGLCLIAIFGYSPVLAMYAAFLIPVVTVPVTYFRFRLKESPRKTKVGVRTFILGLGPPLVLEMALFYCCWSDKMKLEPIVFTLGVALSVLLLFLPSVRKRLKAITKPLPTRTSYLLTIAALLILLGVLPALAFFRIAYENEMVLFLKHGQYRLAQSLDARRERLVTESLKIQGGANFFENRMKENASRDVYQNFFFPCNDGFSPPKGPATFGPLELVLRDIRIWMLYDQVAIESQGLLDDSPAEDFARWSRNQSNCLHFVSGASAKEVQPLDVQVPVWWKPISVKWFVISVLLSIGTLTIVAAITSFIAKRIFLIDLEVPPTAGEAPEAADIDRIWDECSREEKLAMFDFASDGFINPANPATNSLLKRGLFSLAPLSFANEAIRKPVEEKGKADEGLLPGKEEKSSAWQNLKWPLLVGVLGLATFLFFSQRKVFEGGVGFLGALAGAVTAFFNLFDEVRGTRR